MQLPDDIAAAILQHHPQVLQPQLDRQVAGDIFTLKAGEYRGGIVIDKAITIRGLGERTVLWHFESPILLITVPGVRLEHIHFVQTGNRPTPLILYEPDCLPTMIECEPKEIWSEIMAADRLIRLGTIFTGETVQLPFEIAPEDAHLKILSEDLPLQCKLEKLVSRNHKGFSLSFTAPDEEGYIFDTFKMSDRQNESKKTVYILTGNVVKPQAQQPLSKTAAWQIQTNNNLRDVYFRDYLAFDEAVLQIVLNESRPAPQRRYYGHIMPVSHPKANSRLVWWLANQASGDAKYNNSRQMSRWARQVLEKGNSLQLGSIQGQFEQSDAPPLSLSHYHLPIRMKKLGAEEISIQISYNGQQKSGGILANMGKLLTGKTDTWQGQVHSLVPWIEALNKAPIALNVGESTVLKFRLKPEEINQLNDGLYTDYAAVAIVDSDAVYVMSASLELTIPQYDFDVEGQQLIFHSNPNEILYFGELQGAQSKVNIINRGRDSIHCTITELLPWVSISDEKFTIPSGEAYPLQVSLTNQANHEVRQENQIIKQAFVVNSAEVPNKSLSVDMNFKLEAPRRPIYRLVLPGKDQLKMLVNLANPESISDLELTFRIRNEGQVDGAFHLDLPQPVQSNKAQNRFALPRGAEETVLLSIPATAFNDAKPSEHELKVSVLVEDDKAQKERLLETIVMQISIVDLRPELSINPKRIALAGSDDKPLLAGENHQKRWQIEVKNVGQADFKGYIRNNSDGVLNVSARSLIKIEAGKSMNISVTTTSEVQNLPAGSHIIEKALEFISENSAINLRADAYIDFKYEFINPEPAIYLKNKAIWLASITEGEAIEHNGSAPAWLFIGNYGNQDWVAEVKHCVSWLHLPYENLYVPKHQVLKIPLYPSESAKNLSAGAYYEENALELRGWSIDKKPSDAEVLRCSARLLVNAKRARLMLADGKQEIMLGSITSGQYLPLEQVFSIINQGELGLEIKQIKLPRWCRLDDGHPKEIMPNERSRRFHIRLSDHTDHLFVLHAESPQVVNDYLVLSDDNDTSFSVPISIIVCPPKLELSSERIMVHSSEKRKRTTQLNRGFMMQNRGELAEHLHIINKGEAPFVLKLDGGFKDKNFFIPDMIKWRIEDSSQKIELINNALILNPQARATFYFYVDPDADITFGAQGQYPPASLTLPNGKKHIINLFSD